MLMAYCHGWRPDHVWDKFSCSNITWVCNTQVHYMYCSKQETTVILEVLTLVLLNIQIFWHVMLCCVNDVLIHTEDDSAYKITPPPFQNIWIAGKYLHRTYSNLYINIGQPQFFRWWIQIKFLSYVWVCLWLPDPKHKGTTIFSKLEVTYPKVKHNIPEDCNVQENLV
jgi:hypothetical protein